MTVFATVATVGFLAAYILPVVGAPTPAYAAEPQSASAYAAAVAEAQNYIAASDSKTVTLERSDFTYSVYVAPKPKPKPTPKPTATGSAASTSSSSSTSSSDSPPSAPVAVPTAGSAKSVAFAQVKAHGWDQGQYTCLVALWTRESGWRVNAYNPSGAYGIPQALPGSKMASAGSDWRTNPATQIAWGLGYISGRYGTPCSAWAHSQATNWY